MLSQFQGKEVLIIPDDVINKISANINKDNDCVNVRYMRKLLKQLKLTGFIPHSSLLVNRFTGKELPYIPKLDEDKLILYFNESVKAFNRISKNRTNVLNYDYVLYKLLHLLGHDNLLQHILLIKNKHRLISYEKMWKNICEELNWEYHEIEYLLKQ